MSLSSECSIPLVSSRFKLFFGTDEKDYHDGGVVAQYNDRAGPDGRRRVGRRLGKVGIERVWGERSSDRYGCDDEA